MDSMNAFEAAIARGDIDIGGYARPFDDAAALAAFIADDENRYDHTIYDAIYNAGKYASIGGGIPGIRTLSDYADTLLGYGVIGERGYMDNVRLVRAAIRILAARLRGCAGSEAA